MFRPGALAVGAIAIAIIAALALSELTSANAPITLSTSDREIKSGQAVILRGSVTNPPAIGHVVLYGTHPGAARRRITATAVTSDGSFSFTEFPDRDTTYSVQLVGRPAMAHVAVDYLKNPS